MRKGAWDFDSSGLRGLYRDRENGWIYGVCAGIADRFDLDVLMVRAIAVICLILFFWLTAAIYIAAVLLIREKPLIYSGRHEEYEFWKRRRATGDHWRES